MFTLTAKENYLATFRGECPEWVPTYSFGLFPGMEGPVASQIFEPSIIGQYRMDGGGKDIWGVNHIPTYETGNALIPEPNNFILTLDQLPHWQDIIKPPSLDGIDWEAMVKKQIDASGLDRSQTAVAMNLHGGYFQELMGMMGFTEGLMAFYEEPDAVKELLDFMSDYCMKIADATIDLFNPDIIMFMDDTAAWGNPFISVDMYREFVLPQHEKWAKRGRERGLIMAMHNCGKSECFMPMLVEMGIQAWDPAQSCNDLVAIKEQFGNRLVICGGWDPLGRLLEPDVTEEELRQSVRDTMDKYAVGGGYVWMGNYLSPLGDEEAARKNGILADEAEKYGRAFYGN